MTKLLLSWDPVVKDPGNGVSFEEHGAVWSVVLRSHGESSRDHGGVHQLCAQGDQVLVPTRRDLQPWSGRFFASLMLSQVPCNWIGTEVVFHSAEVLRLCGESSWDLGGVHRLRAQGDPVLVPTGRASLQFF